MTTATTLTNPLPALTPTPVTVAQAELFLKLFPPDEALEFFDANETPRPVRHDACRVPAHLVGTRHLSLTLDRLRVSSDCHPYQHVEDAAPRPGASADQPWREPGPACVVVQGGAQDLRVCRACGRHPRVPVWPVHAAGALCRAVRRRLTATRPPASVAATLTRPYSLLPLCTSCRACHTYSLRRPSCLSWHSPRSLESACWTCARPPVESPPTWRSSCATRACWCATTSRSRA